MAKPINRTFDGDIRDGVRANETRIREFPTVVMTQKGILTTAFMKNGSVLLDMLLLMDLQNVEVAKLSCLAQKSDLTK